MKHYYSIGTAAYAEIMPEARLVGDAVTWLTEHQNGSGTWGGPDALDEFITTTHVLMALFAVGVSPDAPGVADALGYLRDLDTERNLSFYWRSGVFLNLPDFRHIVRSDAEFIWANVGQVAVHRQYPIYFFLLKLVLFGGLESELTFSVDDVLRRVLDDWKPESGWYGRTSITTMALGLIYDVEFSNKRRVLEASVSFVERHYRNLGGGDGQFDQNLVDDAFSIFNLAERDFFRSPLSGRLARQAATVAHRLVSSALDASHWRSAPPFGGSIGTEIYPTAVIIRALLAFHRQSDIREQVCGVLIDTHFRTPSAAPGTAIAPFWGPILTEVDETLCFVLMPFHPPKLTQIFERYVRQPIELQLRMRCVRADDLLEPNQIMSDVWVQMNRARVIVADLTDRNANVFYELGMAHVLGKPTILITQSAGDLPVPFDVHGIRRIVYEDSPEGYEELSSRLIATIQAITRREVVRTPSPLGPDTSSRQSKGGSPRIPNVFPRPSRSRDQKE